MNKQNKKCTVLMTGPAASVQGGIRTVVNQYLDFGNWENTELVYIPSHIEGTAVRKMLFFAGSVLKISAACAARPVDILHMHVSERGSFWRKAFLLKMCRKKGIKTILHHHGAEFFDFYEKASPKAKAKIGEIIFLADVNLVLSEYHRTKMLERFPQGKFEVLYNAIPDAAVQPYNTDACGILFVGRMGKRKGIYDLIAALEDLEAVLPPEVTCFFCGDGEVETIAQLLRQKKLEHRVGHIGWCSKEQLREFYGQTMLFILPSYHEGLPMSLLEAMYAGIPCITTRVDGIPEVIETEENGLLVTPGDIKQIKGSLLRLLQDQKLRKKLGENAHQTVCGCFLLKKQIEKLNTLYLELEGVNHV